MPAFTFEKISSPVRSTTAPVAITTPSQPSASKQVSAKRSRGLLVQIIDRFALARIKRDTNDDARDNLPLKHPPPD